MIKAKDAVQASTVIKKYAPTSMIKVSKPNYLNTGTAPRASKAAHISIPDTTFNETQSSDFQELKKNFAILEGLQSRLRFMLTELEDLIKE